MTTAAVRVFERDLTYFRRVWRAVVMASLIQPLMFLLGVGIGVGALVDAGPNAGDVLGDVSYFAFYATALIATTPMFVCGQEALWPTMEGFAWSNAYRAMIATPLGPRDVLFSRMLVYAFRALLAAGGVGFVLVFFDDTRTWGLIPAVGAGVLTGLAVAMPIAAWTASRETDSSFPGILRFAIIPMFLFGGAFYPVDQLPDVLEPIAWIVPLWHGVELCRGAVIGGLSAAMAVVHLAVLLVYIAGGSWIASRTFDRRLRP